MNLVEFLEKKEQFFNYLIFEKKLAKNTSRAYKLDIEQFVTFWENNIKTKNKEFNFQEIVGIYNVVLNQKDMDKRSIARKLSCLSSIIKFLRTKGLDLDIKFVRPKLEQKSLDFLEEEDIKFLTENVPNESIQTQRPLRDKAILDILYCTGILCSEIVEIKVQDIDWNARSIKIKGKGKKDRTVIFNSNAGEKLKKYIKQERTLDQEDTTKEQSEHLFLNYRGTKLTTRSIQRICQGFEKFLENKKTVTPHKLRHSYTVHMLNQGIEIKKIEEQLGLKSLEIMKRYTPKS